MSEEIATGGLGSLREVLEDMILDSFDQALSLALDAFDMLTQDEKETD